MRPKIIEGNCHRDERGELRFINDFDMSGVKRFYLITHFSCETVRAWQGHKKEGKFFYCIKGSFTLGAVEIDDWQFPSANLEPELFELSADKNQIVSISAGYANGFRANEVGSRVIVYSTSTLEESKDDDYRFDHSLWSLSV